MNFRKLCTAVAAAAAIVTGTLVGTAGAATAAGPNCNINRWGNSSGYVACSASPGHKWRAQAWCYPGGGAARYLVIGPWASKEAEPSWVYCSSNHSIGEIYREWY